MVVPAEGALVEYLLDVLHGVGARVGGYGAGLPDRVDVAHVPDRGHHCLVLLPDGVVYLFVGGVGAGHLVVLVLVGVVGPAYGYGGGY